MANEVAILWVAISGIIGLVVGALVVFFSFRSGVLQKGKVTELETRLEAAQQEMTDYRQQVFNQFSDTADKFRALDESYHALHRQLAQSSVALCGDQATPLLTAEDAPQTITAAPGDLDDAGPDEAIQDEAIQDEAIQDETIQDEISPDEQTDGALDAEADAEADVNEDDHTKASDALDTAGVEDSGVVGDSETDLAIKTDRQDEEPRQPESDNIVVAEPGDEPANESASDQHVTDQSESDETDQRQNLSKSGSGTS